MGQASSVSSPLQCALPAPLARLLPSYEDAEQRDQWAAKEADRRRRQQRHEDEEEKARQADDAKADEGDEGEGGDGADAADSDASGAADGDAGGSGPDPGGLRRGFFFDPDVERARKVMRMAAGGGEGQRQEQGEEEANGDGDGDRDGEGDSLAVGSVSLLDSPPAPQSAAMRLLLRHEPRPVTATAAAVASAAASSSSSSTVAPSFTSAAAAHSAAAAPAPPRPRLPLAALERVFSFLPLGPLLRLGRVDRRHYAGVQRAGSLGAAGAVLRLLDQRGGAALIGRVAHHAVLCHVRALQLGRFAADPLLGPAPRPPSPAPAPEPAEPSRLWLAADGRPIDLGVLGDADPAVADGDEDDGDGLSRKWREGRRGTAAGDGRDGAAGGAESASLPPLLPPMDHPIDIFPAAVAAVSATSAGANAENSDEQSPPSQSHAHLSAAAQPLLLALSHGSLSPVSPDDGANAAVTAIDADDSDDECDEAERAAIALERAHIESHARAHLAESLALDVDLRGNGHGADQERMEPSRSRPAFRSRRHSHSRSRSHSPSRRSDGSLLRRGSGAFGSSRPPLLPSPPQWHFSAAALAPLSFLPQLRSLALAFHPTDTAPLLMGAAAAGGAEADPDADAEADAEATVKAVVGEGGGSDAGPIELVLAFQSLAPLLRSLELRPAAMPTHQPASSSVAAAASASEIILHRLDAPLPSPSCGLESFRRQTAEGAAGRSEFESQSQSRWQSVRVCSLLLWDASQLRSWSGWSGPCRCPLPHFSPSRPLPPIPPQPLERVPSPPPRLRIGRPSTFAAWPRADSNAADADPASASGSSPNSVAAVSAAAAVLDSQLQELQIALSALRMVQLQ